MHSQNQSVIERSCVTVGSRDTSMLQFLTQHSTILHREQKHNKIVAGTIFPEST